ncbi:uncharacterized protein LOC122463991 isoform X2 [Chelonia mydas]|uniref:uncharacterized protein LOC122463991 isoform X2 n=1 Tax=Chelonia mydas TaxID=8469 RepID=UPI001CA8FE94|nr:uncharacterized protein LOC122463991 isoform X2 [Chelonia mydas]
MATGSGARLQPVVFFLMQLWSVNRGGGDLIYEYKKRKMLHKKHERSQDKLKFHTDNDLFTLLYTLHAEIHTNAMDHGQEPQGPPGDSSQAPFRTAQGIGTNATMKMGSGNRQFPTEFPPC